MSSYALVIATAARLWGHHQEETAEDKKFQITTAGISQTVLRNTDFGA